MKLAPRLLLTFLAAAILGAAVGANAGGPVAALQPSATPSDETTSEKALRAALWAEARHLGAELREALAQAITRAEKQHDIPALLLVSLIVQESGFDPTAENAGAIGLMQLRPFVAKDYARRRGIQWSGEATLLDPVRNVQIASGYFGELIDRFGSLDLALAAYNKGPECVKRQLRAGNDTSPTARFALDVLGRYQRYNSRFASY